MKINLPFFNRGAKAASLVPALGAAVVVAGAAALAGTDTTFSTAATSVTGWLEGSLGTTIAVVALVGGVVASAIQFRWQLLAGSVAVALAASMGPGIVSGLLTATV
ncbi:MULTISPECIES: hypothetical protein [Alphaproteobacteria]|jgi:conjugal transfer pilus assembly protein TraA|uniref:TrbC/VIRB2 family protein n=1 Tax=Maricaulis virginensis TaxID=144022 RepID=A0A9W6INY9_9PROT|nr:hypothetical protein [Maricaulis virginensis]GLK53528.1 hypothetical protein GCM10017621_30360 [Maricaulis virginensis]